ncbi:MAG: extensin family protein [Pseudomonadota bacterium]
MRLPSHSRPATLPRLLATGLLLAGLGITSASAETMPLPRERMDAGRALTADALVAAAGRVSNPAVARPSATVPESAQPFAATAAARPSLFERLAAANRKARADKEARRERLLTRTSAAGAASRALGKIMVPGPAGDPIPLKSSSCDGAANFVAAYVKAEPVEGRGACGIAEPIRVSALTRHAVTVAPSATLNCPITNAIADWMRESVVAAAEAELGAKPARIVNSSSYACRTRGHRRGARLSEHAFGNALDIGAFVLEDGRRVDVKHHPKGSPEARFLAAIRKSACTYFTTVLGPGYNRAHADHFHLDIARHTASGDYRFCR